MRVLLSAYGSRGSAGPLAGLPWRAAELVATQFGMAFNTHQVRHVGLDACCA